MEKNSDNWERAMKFIRLHYSSQELKEEYVETIIMAIQLLKEWKIDPASLDELNNIDAILAFSFGFGPKKETVNVPKYYSQYHPHFHYQGKTNKGLAKVIHDFLITTKKKIGEDIVIYAQWEIAESLYEDYKLSIIEGHTLMPKENYLSTIGVIEQSIESGLGNYSHIGIVAQELHAPRCKMKTLEKFACLDDRQRNFYLLDTSDVPWDPESVQEWPRDHHTYIPHDIAERFAPYKFARK